MGKPLPLTLLGVINPCHLHDRNGMSQPDDTTKCFLSKHGVHFATRYINVWAGSRRRIRVADLRNGSYQGCAGHRGATRTPRARSSSIFFNTNGNMSNRGVHKRARLSPQSYTICACQYLRRAIGCSSTGKYGKTTASGSYALQRDSTIASVAQTVRVIAG
jgi:hypothetical protein